MVSKLYIEGEIDLNRQIGEFYRVKTVQTVGKETRIY